MKLLLMAPFLLGSDIKQDQPNAVELLTGRTRPSAYLQPVRPGVAMLLNPDTCRPRAVQTEHGQHQDTYIVQSEVRNVVPPDRDELLLPCPLQFQPEPLNSAVDESGADWLTTAVAVLQFMVPGF